jgi:hypothetical protein
MLFRLNRVSLQAVLAASFMIGFAQSHVSAGPFADWWINQNRPTYPLTPGTPAAVTRGYGNYGYNAYTGYPNTSYSPVLPQGLPQTNVGFLPTGAYASQYYKAPTTYYRPVTSFDPNLGTTITSLQPCTSYQYQAQRVPLLTPAWQNYPYEGYGSTSQPNYYPPYQSPNLSQPSIASPMVGSAAGQSSLSIASGFGTYGTAPVVQSPYGSAPLAIPVPGGPTIVSPAPNSALPLSSAPIVSGYGGIHYGTPITSTIVGSPVVPAASWAPTPTSPSATTYSSIPTYPSSTQSNFAPTYPSSTYPSTSLPTTSLSNPLPTTSTYAPMPGSMGLPTVPSAVSPSAGWVYPSTLPLTTSPESTSPVYPPIIPSTTTPPMGAAPSVSPPAFPPLSSNSFDSESTKVPRLLDSPNEALKPESETAERPRFQLRSVEQSPQTSSNLNPSSTPSAPSPWLRNENSNASKSNPFNTPAPSGNPSSNTEPENDSKDPELKLNTDALRPIPAPSDFDASPDWKPSLLNARDQTAKTSNVVPITGRSPNAVHKVQFLQSIQPAPMPTRIESTSHPRIEIRPAGS